MLHQRHVNLRVCLCEGNWSACFPVHQSSQSSLAFDDAVRYTHLTTQSGQENDELKKEKKRKYINILTQTKWRERLEVSGPCSGLKSSSVLIYTETSGEEIQTSLQGTTL